MKTSYFKTSRRNVAAAIFAIFVVAGKAGAATIIWSASGNISGDSDVNSTGNSVYAYSFDTASHSVNGVNFASGTVATPDFTVYNTPSVFTGFGSASAPFAGLSSEYQQVLSNGRFGGPTAYLNLNQLTLGTTYEVQLFLEDARGSYPSLKQATFTAGNTSAPISYDTTGLAGGLGQYVLGTFTADANYESITITSPYSAQINAFQLREPASVPEPSTYALMLGSLGVLALVTRARKLS